MIRHLQETLAQSQLSVNSARGKADDDVCITIYTTLILTVLVAGPRIWNSLLASPD